MNESNAPVIFARQSASGIGGAWPQHHGRTDQGLHAASGAWCAFRAYRGFLGSADPSADDLARHVTYVADLVGVGHVGIGTDISFTNQGSTTRRRADSIHRTGGQKLAGYEQALAKVAYVPVIVWRELPAALSRVGLEQTDTKKIMGGNIARVARQAWDKQ